MSIGAYRVISKRIGNQSFNVWHEPAIMEWLESHAEMNDQRNDDGCGELSLTVKSVEAMLEAIGSTLDPETSRRIKADIKAEKRRGNDFIMYDCF